MKTCALGKPSGALAKEGGAANDDAWARAAGKGLAMSVGAPAKTLDALVSHVSSRRLAFELLDAPVSNNSPCSSSPAWPPPFLRRDLRITRQASSTLCSLPGSGRKALYGAGPHPMFFHLTFSPRDSTAGIGGAMDKEWCSLAKTAPFIGLHGAQKVSKTKRRASCTTRVLDYGEHHGYNRSSVPVRPANAAFTVRRPRRGG